MINLLPPERKQQLRFARLNARLRRYLILLIVVIVINGLIFAGSLVYLNFEQQQVTKGLAVAQSDIAGYAAFKQQAEDTSTRLTAIKNLRAAQTRFSLLLTDLSKVMPAGDTLGGITLTGDASKPVQITVTANSYNNALAFRDALVNSPRIAAADLENVSQASTGYTATVVIAFKPGMAQ